jgi:hypothetical protein
MGPPCRLPFACRREKSIDAPLILFNKAYAKNDRARKTALNAFLARTLADFSSDF